MGHEFHCSMISRKKLLNNVKNVLLLNKIRIQWVKRKSSPSPPCTPRESIIQFQACLCIFSLIKPPY